MLGIRARTAAGYSVQPTDSMAWIDQGFRWRDLPRNISAAQPPHSTVQTRSFGAVSTGARARQNVRLL